MNAPGSIPLNARKDKKFFLIGFMGSGKTHWGKIWAAANQLSFVDLDGVIEKETGSTIAEIFETKGEDHFRKLEAAALRNCSGLQNTIIACGGGTPCFFDNMPWMNEHGTTIYIICSPIEILERVLLEKETRPLLKKLNRAELLFFIEQKLREREPFYGQATLAVKSAELDQNAFPSIISNITS
ncbi:MAG: shikimate kinase [Ferruginibacter sp.]|nr:shikimate kinase [Ferruginibacter sp.]